MYLKSKGNVDDRRAKKDKNKTLQSVQVSGAGIGAETLGQPSRGKIITSG
jgi:hypothetical protein